MLLANPWDVERRLGRRLSPDLSLKVEGLLEEAGALVRGWLGEVPEPVPSDVTVVVSRMVARVIDREAAAPSPAADSVITQMGPFSRNVGLTGSGSGGGVWLTSNDKSPQCASGERRRGCPRVGETHLLGSLSSPNGPLGYGVIGSTSDSGSLSLGSSPGIPAPRQRCRSGGRHPE